MLLPADLLLSLTTAQSPGRSESSAQAVLPVVDVAAVQSWLDTPGGQGDHAQTDPRALINQLLSGMTEQQSDSFAVDFVSNLQALLPAEQPLNLSAPANFLPAQTGTDALGNESGLPVQWTVDELLKFSEMILPPSPAQPAVAADSGSALPPAEQNSPQVLVSALAALQGKSLQGADLLDASRQAESLQHANSQGQPGLLSLDFAQPVPGEARPDGLQLPRPEAASFVSLDGQTVPLMMTGRPAESASRLTTPSQVSELIQPASSSGQPSLTSQVSADSAAILPAAANPAADKISAQLLVPQSPDGRPPEVAGNARSQPSFSDTLTMTDSVMQADRRPLVVAMDAALQSANTDPSRSLDAATSRQDTAAALLSTAAPTAAELAQELYGADQRRQLASQARESTVASQQLAAPGRAVSDNLQMGSFGQTQWGENVSRQLLMMTANGVNSAQIRLDPPELGTLTIKVKLIDQAATVNFVSQHAMVRDALELQIPRLQEQFRQEGLDLVDVSVSDQSAQQGGAQGDERQGGRADRFSGTEEEDLAASPTLVHQSSHLIDFYA